MTTKTQEWYVDPRSGVRMPAGVLRFPIDRLITAPWNPNQQDPATFKNLVDSIREHGFLDIPQVAPLDTPELRAEHLDASHDSGEYWLIIGGAHRKDAGKMLDMECLPAILISGWSSDMVKFQNMRLNSLKGRVDPERFFKLYTELKAKGYGDDMLKHQMGLVQRNALKKLIKGVKRELPKEMAQALDDEDVQNPDDLARVLKELFSKYGDTLPLSLMVFTFGGKTHLWYEMNRARKDAVDALREYCTTERINLNDALGVVFEDALNRVRAAKLPRVPAPGADFS